MPARSSLRTSLEPRRVTLKLNAVEGGKQKLLVPSFIVSTVDGRRLVVPATDSVKSVNAGRKKNFVVLKSKQRTIVLYGDDHDFQNTRTPETWRKLLSHAAQFTKTPISQVVAELDYIILKRLRDMGLTASDADMPFKAMERSSKRLDAVSFDAVSRGFNVSGNEFGRHRGLEFSRRNASMLLNIVRASKQGDVFSSVGLAHVQDIARLLKAIGYKVVYAAKHTPESFASEMEIEIARRRRERRMNEPILF